MSLPDLRLALVVGGLLLGAVWMTGCAGKAGRTDGAQQAPSHLMQDEKTARKRLRYSDLLHLSANRLGNGLLDEALRHARAAEKVDPSQPDALTMQAVVLAEQGRSEEAGGLYRKAAEMAPARGDVLSNYGAWLCATGFPAEALVWFDRALALPDYADKASALANAGGCALEAGQRERAGRDLARALELAPANPYALESMARHEFELGRYFEARAFYQRRLAAAPATKTVLQQAIQIEDRLGDRAAADLYHQRLRQEFPSEAAKNPQG